MVAQIWLTMARYKSALQLGKVESKANVADGPTRESLDLLMSLNAQYVKPTLPLWMRKLWGDAQFQGDGTAVYI